MADWNIGINAEGADVDKENMKRRANLAIKWAREGFIKQYQHIITVLNKKSVAAMRKEIDQDIAMHGVAIELIKLIEERIPNAIAQVKKEGHTISKDKEKALKIQAVGLAVKAIAKDADELKKM